MDHHSGILRRKVMIEEIFCGSHSQLYQLEVTEAAGEVEALISLDVLEGTVETSFHSVTANMGEERVCFIQLNSVGGRIISKRVVEMIANDV